MAVSYDDLGSGLRRITFSGRLDIQGTEDIAPQFSAWATDAQRNVIVDFTGVTFLASIGIRALISNAKALHKLGGRMAVVVGDNIPVFKTLESTGIDVLLQIFKEFHDAEKALGRLPI
jgi:anti-sigma B factor antagonist